MLTPQIVCYEKDFGLASCAVTYFLAIFGLKSQFIDLQCLRTPNSFREYNSREAETEADRILGKFRFSGEKEETQETRYRGPQFK